MNCQKNIISSNDSGFSLVEVILAISIGTFILIIIVSGIFILHKGLSKAKDEAVLIYDISKFAEMVINDTLNPDLFPHHPYKPTGQASKDSEDDDNDSYIFTKDSIVFFANGSRVEYKFTKSDDNKNEFTIIRGEEENAEDAEKKDDNDGPIYFIKDFSIDYYDKKDFEIIDFNNEEDFPFYCKLNFKFYDNKTLSIDMKL